MTNRDFEILYKKVCQEVTNNELNSALGHLKEMTDEIATSYLEEQRQDIESTYLNMLKYTVNKVNDPDREQIYNKIQISILELSDVIRDVMFTKNSNNIVYQQKRLSTSTLTEIPIEFYSTQQLNAIFQLLWLTDKFNADLTSNIRQTYTSTQVPDDDKAVFTSAITLSLIRTFDENKFHLLLDLMDNESIKIRQRALIGLLFAANLHSDRIKLYKQLRSRINFIFQDEVVAENLQTTVLQILLSKETAKISKKMNEALPEIIKDTPLDKNGKKINWNDILSDDPNMTNMNPQWESLLENSSVSEKAKELSQLQMEGGDLFMGTFSALKNYAFFNTIENWFLPYFNETVVQRYDNRTENNDIARLVKDSIFLCDSDKYSMYFSINTMPAQYMEMIRSTFKMEKEQSDIIKNDERYLAKNTILKDSSRMYLQDLYRFYNLYNYKNDFVNPFVTVKDFHNNFLVLNNPKSDEISRAIADFYIQKEYYKEARKVLVGLESSQSTNVELLQKIGHCYQQEKEYHQAISYYEKAETIQSNTLWNLQRLAYCEKCLGNYTKSIQYYHQCEELAPNDSTIQINIGYCQMNLGNYTEALKIFYKVDYLFPDNKKTAKAIAWCSFATQKLEQAEKYYLKTNNNERNENDWMNIGNILLCQNKIDEAIRHYQEAYLKMDKNKKKFSDFFKEDYELLIRNGIELKQLNLLRDYILYQIEK